VLVTQADFEMVVRSRPPELADGEALMRTIYLGMERDGPHLAQPREGYMRRFEVGWRSCVQRIGASWPTRSPAFPIGDALLAAGWVRGTYESSRRRFTPSRGRRRPAPMMKRVRGDGAAAYFGLSRSSAEGGRDGVRIGGEGDHRVDRRARSPTKIPRCRVTASPGTGGSAPVVVDELGLDGCINHRTEDIPRELKQLCHIAVDVFFENVGGEVIDGGAGPAQHAGKGRAPCGRDLRLKTGTTAGPANYST